MTPRIKKLIWHECLTHGGRMLIASALGMEWRVRPAGFGHLDSVREEREKAAAQLELETAIMKMIEKTEGKEMSNG